MCQIIIKKNCMKEILEENTCTPVTGESVVVVNGQFVSENVIIKISK